MNFVERKILADAFEARLRDRLNETGWPACRFGQALLPEECRLSMKKFKDESGNPCLIRWMPDIITWRDLQPGKSFVALIDAKVCGGETSNYSLEIDAIKAAGIYVERFCTPTFFVFDDWKALTPHEARQYGTRGPASKKGSGTPYLLVCKKYGWPMEDIFPPAT